MTPELSDSGLPQKSIDTLVSLYTEAAERMKQMVLHPPGGTASSRDFKQARAAQLANQIDMMLAKLKNGTGVWIGENLPQAFVDGLKRAETQAKAIGIDIPDSPLSGSFSLIDHGAVGKFAHDISKEMTNDLVGKDGAMTLAADRAKSVLRKTAQLNLGESEIDRILAGGVIDGTPVQTVHKLRDAFKAVGNGTVVVKDKNGDLMNFDAGYYAGMVARTKTREATVKARHERLQQLDLDLVAIVGLVSTHFCTAFLGQVFSLSGKSDKYPAYSSLPGGGPPFHPNCSKSTRPFVPELANETQLEQADGLDDADKLLGMDQTQAHRAFNDLQLHAQQKDRYASTAKKLFGKAAA